MDLTPIAREPMKLPAPARLVFGLLLCGLFLNSLPWSGKGLMIHPDFLLVVLLYWSVQQPRDVGQGWAFLLGLVMDVSDSMLLGQHSLIYVGAIFLAQMLRLRLLHLTLFEQALHIGAILMFARIIDVLLNLSLGYEFAGWWLFVAPLLGALCWPAVDFVATLPRFRRQRQGIGR